MKGKTKRTPVYKLTLSSTKNGTARNLSSTVFSVSSTKNGIAKQYQKRDMERSDLKSHRKGVFSEPQNPKTANQACLEMLSKLRKG